MARMPSFLLGIRPHTARKVLLNLPRDNPIAVQKFPFWHTAKTLHAQVSSACNARSAYGTLIFGFRVQPNRRSTSSADKSHVSTGSPRTLYGVDLGHPLGYCNYVS